MLRIAVPLLLLALPAAAQDLSGAPTVMTGDTIEIAGTRVRLYGIDAPEEGQSCSLNDKTYDCGLVAASGLKDLTAGARLTCVAEGTASDGMPLVTCRDQDGFDVNRNMVYTGWALADPHVPRYAAIEANARTKRRGLWRGRVVPPWEWRAGSRTEIGPDDSQ